MNSKNETNGRVKLGQESRCATVVYPLKELKNSEQQERNKWQGQNGPRIKMGYYCLPPERVELTVNSKKDTNGRVKMGQRSRWAAVAYPLKESNNSEQQERNKWQGQNGPRVKWAKGQDGLLLFTKTTESN